MLNIKYLPSSRSPQSKTLILRTASTQASHTFLSILTTQKQAPPSPDRESDVHVAMFKTNKKRGGGLYYGCLMFSIEIHQTCRRVELPNKPLHQVPQCSFLILYDGSALNSSCTCNNEISPIHINMHK